MATKAEAIRGMLSTHPEMGPKLIRETLADKGINVSMGQISSLKWEFKSGKKGKKSKNKNVKTTIASTNGFTPSIPDLLEAKKFLANVQTPERAIAAIKLLSQLVM